MASISTFDVRAGPSRSMETPSACRAPRIDGANYTVTPNSPRPPSRQTTAQPASVSPPDDADHTRSAQWPNDRRLRLGGWRGPAVACPGDGATTAQITFRTVIQDEFTDDFPSGE